jgi:hypothetical protein
VIVAVLVTAVCLQQRVVIHRQSIIKHKFWKFLLLLSTS